MLYYIKWPTYTYTYTHTSSFFKFLTMYAVT